MSGNVYNVLVRNMHFQGAMFAGRIKSGRGRGGNVHNITFEDITLEHTVVGMAISMLYASGGEPAPPFADTTPHIEDVTYRRVSGTAGNAGAFLCLPESQCRGLHMEDVNVTSFLGGFECLRATGDTAGIISPAACFE
jgi:polygalacturonase